MQDENLNTQNNNQGRQPASIRGMYQDWFLDYASYVILERAIPHVDDGLKPVQRRILHSMHELDDGRYNKVANIVGNTMKYHPHGDASIGDAITGLGQKEIMIDTQGNWGNILTGDSAAAPRYIEARLSKFALEVAFNYRTTTFHPSYDGRNQEPDTLPIKFPLLLAQGAKGIAVGLACEILPHNFVELLDASISILKNEPFVLYPDFPTGGLMDVSEYNDGVRGGRLLIRARIQREDAKTLVITEIPYSTTSDSLIDSIAKANDAGKLKLKKIENNTAKNAEIRLHLPNDVSVDQTIDALFAFTDCQKSISPNSCVIDGQRPCFMPVSDILRRNTQTTVELLKKELELDLQDLKERWQWISLERIFIENEIYEDIKPCTTDESINQTIFKGLEPFVKGLIREVTLDDVLKLRKIPIDRISKYNSDKAQNDLAAIETDMEEVKNNLEHLTDYAIRWYKHLKDKYGKGRERKTEIRSFHRIEVTQAAAATEKLYCNFKEGFAGYKLKGDNVEYIADCSTLDDIIVIRQDGTYVVKKVQEKDFVGKDIIHIAVFKRNDERTIYNIMYNNGPYGRCFAKRCAITGVIRDKEYDFTQGVKGSGILYFSANPNGEAEKVTVYLKARPRMRRLSFIYDFAELAIKGRGAHGNVVDPNPVRRVSKKTGGVSTLKAQKIWLDTSIMQLNTLERGNLLGEFKGGDKILIITQKGTYRITDPDLNLHFDDDTLLIEKYKPTKPITIIYWENEASAYYIKRFIPEMLSNDRISFLDSGTSVMKYCLTDWLPVISIDGEEKEATDLTDIMKYKAKGKKISKDKKAKIKILDPLPYEEPKEEEPQTDIESDEFFNSQTEEDNGVQASLF
ncbi:MAG: DNA gyrase/topoisomerase IV subunit A [Bacteroidales bacterium]|nr:DNA gyrase/topoisomerase IV subunit A [Bacteroidales bacterium]